MKIFDRLGQVEGEYCDVVFVREQKFPIENQFTGVKMQDTETTTVTTTAELPKYKSHKIVEAVKITRIDQHPNGSAVLFPEDPAYDAIEVPPEYMTRVPLTGEGYFVRYEDGYESWSPAEAFESGYAKLEETQAAPQNSELEIPDYSHEGTPTHGDIDNWGRYHTPKPHQLPRYGELRDGGLTLMRLIKKNCPPGADRTAAIRKVREAIMTANAAIACGE